LTHMEAILELARENPDDFKVVWPDMDEQQWAPENSPEAFYHGTYGINHLKELMDMMLPPTNKDVKMRKDDILKAPDFLLSNWPTNTHFGDTGGPPDYIDLGGRCISLTYAFQALAYSLSYYVEHGVLPEVLVVRDIYGPVDTPMFDESETPTPELVQSQGLPGCSSGPNLPLWWPLHTMADGKDVLDAAVKVAKEITDRIPGKIKVRMLSEASGEKQSEMIEVYVNPAEFLYAMAQVFQGIHFNKKPSSALLVAMKVVEAQPGGLLISPPAFGGEEKKLGAFLGQQLYFRHKIDPSMINATWNYMPPKGVGKPPFRTFAWTKSGAFQAPGFRSL